MITIREEEKLKKELENLHNISQEIEKGLNKIINFQEKLPDMIKKGIIEAFRELKK